MRRQECCYWVLKEMKFLGKEWVLAEGKLPDCWESQKQAEGFAQRSSVMKRLKLESENSQQEMDRQERRPMGFLKEMIHPVAAQGSEKIQDLGNMPQAAQNFVSS
jgi:hypothetical protein